MTALAEAVLHGYTISIEDLGDGRGLQAFVSRGRFSANLWTLEETCALESDKGGSHEVSGDIIGDLANWAYQNGL